MNHLLSQSTPMIIDLVLEYAKLATQASLTDTEADRLDEILEMATENPTLNFWMTELEHLISHRLGLLNEDDRESYKDQQAMMREYGVQNDSVMYPRLNNETLQREVTEPSTPIAL